MISLLRTLLLFFVWLTWVDSRVPQAYGSYGGWEKYCKIRLYGSLPLPQLFEQFINAATKQGGKTVGHKLKSYTSDVRAVRYSRDQGSPPVVFVDTPGFDDTNKPDTEILRIIAQWLEKT